MNTETRHTLTAEPFRVPEWDDDPMGVYRFQPIADELEKLYFELDPETDDDFDEKVHGANTRLMNQIVTRYNNHAALVEALRDLRGDLPAVDDKGICRWCGRDYSDDKEVRERTCPSDDCPSFKCDDLLSQLEPKVDLQSKAFDYLESTLTPEVEL